MPLNSLSASWSAAYPDRLKKTFAADDVHRRSLLSWKKESGLKRVSARPLIDACAERRCFTSARKR